jgi:hypothetical protein
VIGAGALAVAIGVFAIVLAVAGEPELAVAGPDRKAADRMLALMRASERVNYVVDYATTRRVRGGASRTTVSRRARWHDVEVNREGDALDIESARDRFHCQLVDGGPSCYESAPGSTLAPSEVFAAALGTETYVVAPARQQRIADERATCFETRSVDGRPRLAGIGRATVLCFAADGVPLRVRVDGPDAVDDRVATRVVRPNDRRALEPVLAGFDQKTPGAGG